MKLITIALLMISIIGCFSLSKESPELLPKLQESEGPGEMGTGAYLFRIFGNNQPYLALYNPRTGALSHIYGAHVSYKGDDFWQQLRADMRMTRESRYFAASSALNPGAFLRDATSGEASGSFRADIFRGDPSKMSAIGRNVLFGVKEVIFQSESQPPQATTHIFVGKVGEFHAVPMTAHADLLSFSFVEGLNNGHTKHRWLAVQIDKDGGVPGNTKMGCVSNFVGKILPSATAEESEINAICERQGRAGPS